MATPKLFADSLWFKISLAQWSLHKRFFNKKFRRKLDKAHQKGPDQVRAFMLKDHVLPVDPSLFPEIALKEFGIDAVEYVNTFYFNKKEKDFFELKKRCDDLGVKSVLMMVDSEGMVGHKTDLGRKQTAENHKRWLEYAKLLGCHSIRVNAYSEGSKEEQKELVVDGLIKLVEIAKPYGLNVLVENHGGYSSDGQWLSEVMKAVDDPLCGTLPDFGNFNISKKVSYDKYKGVKELMPFAKAVSAKSHAFHSHRQVIHETNIDYYEMLKIVKDSGYRGYIGIEYEGKKLKETEGIRATKALLERVRRHLA